MARALIAGLIADGHSSDMLRAADPSADAREQVSDRYGIATFDDNAMAAAGADVVVLCVKPQQAAEVCRALALSFEHPSALVISVIAGVSEQSLQSWLGGDVPLVRAMPNTPVLVQSGAIGLHAADGLSDQQRSLAEEILRAGGVTRWVDQESDMDAVTALSGSGPAYYFLIMEALEAAAVAEGLDRDTARLLSIQTALGAARMAMESDEDPQTLRERVTSPGGTTERALGVLEEGGLRDLLARAVGAARQRSEELGRLFAEDGS